MTKTQDKKYQNMNPGWKWTYFVSLHHFVIFNSWCKNTAGTVDATNFLDEEDDKEQGSDSAEAVLHEFIYRLKKLFSGVWSLPPRNLIIVVNVF